MGNDMVKRTLVYWRDIPAQVIVQRGRRREKVALAPRFHEAIDRAAMRAGKGSSDAYLSEWRRETSQLDSSLGLRALAERTAAELEARFDERRLDGLIRRHGVLEE